MVTKRNVIMHTQKIDGAGLITILIEGGVERSQGLVAATSLDQVQEDVPSQARHPRMRQDIRLRMTRLYIMKLKNGRDLV